MVAPSGSQPLHFDASERLRADRMISVFDNGTLEFQYDYCDNIHDGCGFTVGRIGFCTSQGDFLEVVEAFTALVPENPLLPFLPRLKELAATKSESTVGLEALPAAVALAAKNPIFRHVQDKKVDELEFEPASAFADKTKLKLKLSLADIYQAGVQLGWGDDPTSVPMLSKQASNLVVGKYGRWIEACWLESFMTLHRNALRDSPIAAARESVGRGEAMLKIFQEGNLDFHGPIDMAPYGPEEAFHIP